MSHPDVAEFRRLVEARDVKALRRRWPRLQRSFIKFERAAGYRGRPLILNYYFALMVGLREVARRRARAKSNTKRAHS